MNPEVRATWLELLEDHVDHELVRVLEVGCANPDQTMLGHDPLSRAPHRILIDLDPPHDVPEATQVITGNAANLPPRSIAAYDVILCNAVLEHDYHWPQTLDRLKRNLAPRGLLALGVPGFTSTHTRARPPWKKPRRLAWTWPPHGRPNDYYRFSPDAVRRMLEDGHHGLDLVELTTVRSPPIILGLGRRPRGGT